MEQKLSDEIKDSLSELNALMDEYRTLITALKEKHDEADKLLYELRTQLKILKGK